jgi:uncharacterized protein (TIGR02271 family)
MAERFARVPVREERVAVGKRTTTTGKVRVTKTVRERTAVIDEPLAADVVAVERVPIGRFVEGPIPDRYEGQTLVVSVVEEVTVVEKRLRLKEELRITKRRVQRRRPQSVTLRSEEATVERVDAFGGIIHAHNTSPAAPAARR